MEKRFCAQCMMRTVHESLEEKDLIYTYKRKRLLKCQLCGYISKKMALRPSSESVY